MRIVSHASNLSTYEREQVDQACDKLDIPLRDVTGVMFVGENELLVLSTRDNGYKVEALPIDPNKKRNK
jgi:hypothetical protein